MRHDLLSVTVTPAPFSVREATVTGPLIAPAGLALSNPPGGLGTAADTVDLPPVAVGTDEHTLVAEAAHKRSGRSRVGIVAIVNQAWTAGGIGVILPLHPCTARWQTRCRGTCRFDRYRVYSIRMPYLYSASRPVSPSSKPDETTNPTNATAPAGA